jgi:hypothetical protein
MAKSRVGIFLRDEQVHDCNFHVLQVSFLWLRRLVHGAVLKNDMYLVGAGC